MNGKQLKNSILQWAIQGKLVPQDPNDEPASVLLDKIRKEKERLIKEKKIKRDKNASIIFRGDDNSYYEKIVATGEVKCIDEEIPFEVPQGWEWCRLSHIAFSIADGDHMPPPKSTSGIPFLVISNIAKGGLDLNTTRFVPLSYYENISSERTPEYNDILFSVTGSYGIAVRITEKTPFCFQRHIALIKPIHIKAEFLEMLLNSPFVKAQCDAKATGMAQKTVGIDSLRHFLIPVPSTNMQNKIIEKYKELLPLIDKYTVLSDKLEVLKGSLLSTFKKSILQEAIQGKLVPQLAEEGTAQDLLEAIKEEKQRLVKEGKLKKSILNDSVIFRNDYNRYCEKIGKTVKCIEDEIPFEIPENWSWTRGKNIFLPMESEKPKDDFVYIDVDAVNNKKYRIDTPKYIKKGEAPSRASRKLHKNDVLFSMVRPYLKNIAIVTDEYKNAIASTGFYVITPCEGINPLYLYWMMLSSYVVDGLNMFMKGDNSPSINNCHIEEYLYPIPPEKEQQRIVAKMEKLFEQLH